MLTRPGVRAPSQRAASRRRSARSRCRRAVGWPGDGHRRPRSPPLRRAGPSDRFEASAASSRPPASRGPLRPGVSGVRRHERTFAPARQLAPTDRRRHRRRRGGRHRATATLRTCGDPSPRRHSAAAVSTAPARARTRRWPRGAPCPPELLLGLVERRRRQAHGLARRRSAPRRARRARPGPSPATTAPGGCGPSNPPLHRQDAALRQPPRRRPRLARAAARHVPSRGRTSRVPGAARHGRHAVSPLGDRVGLGDPPRLESALPSGTPRGRRDGRWPTGPPSGRCSLYALWRPRAPSRHRPVTISAGISAIARSTRARGLGSADICSSATSAADGRLEYSSVSASSVISSSRASVSAMPCSRLAVDHAVRPRDGAAPTSGCARASRRRRRPRSPGSSSTARGAAGEEPFDLVVLARARASASARSSTASGDPVVARDLRRSTRSDQLEVVTVAGHPGGPDEQVGVGRPRRFQPCRGDPQRIVAPPCSVRLDPLACSRSSRRRVSVGSSARTTSPYSGWASRTCWRRPSSRTSIDPARSSRLDGIPTDRRPRAHRAPPAPTPPGARALRGPRRRPRDALPDELGQAGRAGQGPVNHQTPRCSTMRPAGAAPEHQLLARTGGSRRWPSQICLRQPSVDRPPRARCNKAVDVVADRSPRSIAQDVLAPPQRCHDIDDRLAASAPCRRERPARRPRVGRAAQPRTRRATAGHRRRRRAHRRHRRYGALRRPPRTAQHRRTGDRAAGGEEVHQRAERHDAAARAAPAAGTRRPAAAARLANSSTSRVLPTPAGPWTTTARVDPPLSASRAVSSSGSRPTRGQLVQAARLATGAGAFGEGSMPVTVLRCRVPGPPR